MWLISLTGLEFQHRVVHIFAHDAWQTCGFIRLLSVALNCKESYRPYQSATDRADAKAGGRYEEIGLYFLN